MIINTKDDKIFLKTYTIAVSGFVMTPLLAKRLQFKNERGIISVGLSMMAAALWAVVLVLLLRSGDDFKVRAVITAGISVLFMISIALVFGLGTSYSEFINLFIPVTFLGMMPFAGISGGIALLGVRKK